MAPTPNAPYLASLVLEVWRAGIRTEERRTMLLTLYAESYFGPKDSWTDDTTARVDEAYRLMRHRTRIDEIHYV